MQGAGVYKSGATVLIELIFRHQVIKKAARLEMCASVTMAPNAEEMLLQKDCFEKSLDCNNNDTSRDSGMKRPASAGDLNERCRKLIKSCFVTLTSNLNVLVIGSKGSGKTCIYFVTRFGYRALFVT